MIVRLDARQPVHERKHHAGKHQHQMDGDGPRHVVTAGLAHIDEIFEQFDPRDCHDGADELELQIGKGDVAHPAGAVFVAAGVDLGDEVLVAGKNDDDQQIGHQGDVHQRQNGQHGLAARAGKHHGHRADEGFDKLHQQQNDAQHQADIERRQQPAAAENQNFQSMFDAFHEGFAKRRDGDARDCNEAALPHPHAGLRSRMRFENVEAGLRLFVGGAGGQHHAFAQAELHFARREVGHQYGELADQVFRLVGAGDAGEHIAGARLAVGRGFAHVEGEAQQFGRAFHSFGMGDASNAQIDFGEVVDGDEGVLRGVGSRCCGRHGLGGGLGNWLGKDGRCGRIGLEQGVEALGVDAVHQVLIGCGVLRQFGGVAPDEIALQPEQLARHASGERGQHRAEHDRQQPEPGQGLRAGVLQLGAAGFVFRQNPGLGGVERGVDAVGVGHDFAQRTGVFARFESSGHVVGEGLCGVAQIAGVVGITQLAVEVLADEFGGAAGDVDVFADQVAVDPGDEIFRREVHVFHPRGQLGGEVIAQPLRVEADVEILQRRDAGAPAFAHLLAADSDKTVHIDLARSLAAREVQHGRPEQGVEVDDVLADEMHLLHRRIGDEGVETLGGARGRVPVLCGLPLVEMVFQAGEVADGGVEPDVEVFARRVGNFDAEVGRVARDVPVGQAAVAVFVGGEPLAHLVEHFGLQMRLTVGVGGLRPVAQIVGAAVGRELKEVVLALAQLGRGAGKCGIRVLEFGGRVHRPAYLAGVAVLIGRAALGALPFDVAVGQEHALDRIEKLLDVAHRNQAVLAQRAVDVLRELMVFRRVGVVPVVEADVKAVEVLRPPGGDVGDELLRRLARLLGGDHDGRAVGIVGSDEVHLVALHALKAHPGVGLDVFHDVADVERAVGVGQGGGDEESALGSHGERGGVRPAGSAGACGRCRANGYFRWRRAKGFDATTGRSCALPLPPRAGGARSGCRWRRFRPLRCTSPARLDRDSLATGLGCGAGGPARRQTAPGRRAAP